MLRRTYRRRPRRRKPYRRSLLRLRRIKRRPRRIRKKPRVVYAKKRPWRRRRRWLYRPSPIIRVVHTNDPTTVTIANGGSLKVNAKEALRQRGLWRGIWRQRLRHPPSRLARFINRFYRIPGFEYVIQDYYGRPYQQQRAKRAIQLAHRLANENSNYLRRLFFNRIVRLNVDGQPQNTINVNLGSVRYTV